MYYEIYIDSLFLLNFTLNLYVLMLTNKSLHCAATRRRLVFGAIAGGIGYCLMFIFPVGGVLLKIGLIGVGVNSGILYLVFKPKTVQAFFKMLETMFLYALLLGGVFLLLSNHIEIVRVYGLSMAGVLAPVGLAGLLFSYVTEKQKTAKNRFCRVLLVGKDNKEADITAVIDTGNCLVEPISGAPVSVMDRQLFEKNFGKPEIFRVIPYRSVGCERGIMEGVQISELHIEADGFCKVCQNVYIGLSERPVASGGAYQMLLHPKMLED